MQVVFFCSGCNQMYHADHGRATSALLHVSAWCRNKKVALTYKVRPVSGLWVLQALYLHPKKMYLPQIAKKYSWVVKNLKRISWIPKNYNNMFCMERKDQSPSFVNRRSWTQGHKWAASWQNQQNDFGPSEDSNQPGHLPSLISLCCALNG